MSIWLKVILIVFAAVVVNLGISFISLGNDELPSSAAMQKALQPDPLLDAVFVRPPQADVDACMASVTGSALTHAKIVRVATCLRRKHVVSAKTVAAVKSDTSLGGGTGIGGTGVVGLKSKSQTVWWSFAIWGVALALIILVVYRHRRRPPPARGLQANG